MLLCRASCCCCIHPPARHRQWWWLVPPAPTNPVTLLLLLLLHWTNNCCRRWIQHSTAESEGYNTVSCYPRLFVRIRESGLHSTYNTLGRSKVYKQHRIHAKSLFFVLCRVVGRSAFIIVRPWYVLAKLSFLLFFIVCSPSVAPRKNDATDRGG
jgi:hypothetical protein